MCQHQTFSCINESTLLYLHKYVIYINEITIMEKC